MKKYNLVDKDDLKEALHMEKKTFDKAFTTPTLKGSRFWNKILLREIKLIRL